ncbi:hypothetical protein KDE12_05750 [Campylobacter sp. faydin G-105]|uniref:hypothetical protein n=1 Tax=Campylobacter anatolicus TaxID=2829105 RepID=UPI001B9E8FED|nr:hypothetical protein [Campylobacter anatolicus]MBR8462357.1 hypothetical protein [Campylobacter anatolicus]
MKKFILTLILLSAYVQSYGYDVCDSPEIKKLIEEKNSEPPLKIIDDHIMLVAASCVNNAIEYIFVTSDELFKKTEKSDKSEIKRVICSFPKTKAWLSIVGTGKLINTYINKSLPEKLRISVTEKECKELLPGF